MTDSETIKLKERNFSDFFYGEGNDILDKVNSFDEWWNEAYREGYHLFQEPLTTAPESRIKVCSNKDNSICELINLSSYNYLGMSTSQEVKDAVIDAIRKYGLGACGGPILSGIFDVHEELKKELAQFKNKQACTLFPSGYSANVGFISAIMRPGDHIFLDQYSHASIVDGAILSKAEIKYFRHNNSQDLARKLKDVNGKKLVVVEGLYSMDGDICPLPEIIEVSKRYGARILIDEAHSSFIFGEHGGGVVEHFGVGTEVDFQMGTFSKALGGIGGYVCGSHALIHYLNAYSRSRFFSCTLPPAVVVGVLSSLKIIQVKPEIRRKLWSNVTYIHQLFKEEGINIGNSVSQIVPVMLNDDVKAFAIAEKIREDGVFLQPAIYPGVPKGKSRLRVSVGANHSKQEIEKSVLVISQTLHEYGIL